MKTTKKASKVTDFNNEDYECFSGAEGWGAKLPPMIRYFDHAVVVASRELKEISFCGNPMTVSRDVVEISFGEDACDTYIKYTTDKSRNNVRTMMENMPEDITPKQVLALGFERI